MTTAKDEHARLMYHIYRIGRSYHVYSSEVSESM